MKRLVEASHNSNHRGIHSQYSGECRLPRGQIWIVELVQQSELPGNRSLAGPLSGLILGRKTGELSLGCYNSGFLDPMFMKGRR